QAVIDADAQRVAVHLERVDAVLVAEADPRRAAEPRRRLRRDRLRQVRAGELVVAAERDLHDLEIAVVAAGALGREHRGRAADREQEEGAPLHARARSARALRAPRDAGPRVRSVRSTSMRPSMMTGPGDGTSQTTATRPALG